MNCRSRIPAITRSGLAFVLFAHAIISVASGEGESSESVNLFSKYTDPKGSLSLVSGTVAHGHKLVTLRGPAMTFDITLRYSSNVDMNARCRNDKAPTGWFGLGWYYSPGYIERVDFDQGVSAQHVASSWWEENVPNTTRYFWVGPDGVRLRLIRDVANPDKYFLEERPLWRAKRSSRHDGDGWTVLAPDGTAYVYGMDDSPSSPHYNRYCFHDVGVKNTGQVPYTYRWDLSEIRNPVGGNVRFSYKQTLEKLLISGQQSTYSYTQAAYLSTIRVVSGDLARFYYKGKQTSEYVDNRRATPEPDAYMEFMEDSSVSRIEVRRSGELLREFLFNYDFTSVGSTHKGYLKRQLVSIAEYGAPSCPAGPLVTLFQYYDDPTKISTDTNYNFGALKKIISPRGAAVEFEYQRASPHDNPKRLDIHTPMDSLYQYIRPHIGALDDGREFLVFAAANSQVGATGYWQVWVDRGYDWFKGTERFILSRDGFSLRAGNNMFYAVESEAGLVAFEWKWDSERGGFNQQVLATISQSEWERGVRLSTPVATANTILLWKDDPDTTDSYRRFYWDGGEWFGDPEWVQEGGAIAGSDWRVAGDGFFVTYAKDSDKGPPIEKLRIHWRPQATGIWTSKEFEAGPDGARKISTGPDYVVVECWDFEVLTLRFDGADWQEYYVPLPDSLINPSTAYAAPDYYAGPDYLVCMYQLDYDGLRYSMLIYNWEGGEWVQRGAYQLNGTFHMKTTTGGGIIGEWANDTLIRIFDWNDTAWGFSGRLDIPSGCESYGGVGADYILLMNKTYEGHECVRPQFRTAVRTGPGLWVYGAKAGGKTHRSLKAFPFSRGFAITSTAGGAYGVLLYYRKFQEEFFEKPPYHFVCTKKTVSPLGTADESGIVQRYLYDLSGSKYDTERGAALYQKVTVDHPSGGAIVYKYNNGDTLLPQLTGLPVSKAVFGEGDTVNPHQKVEHARTVTAAGPVGVYTVEETERKTVSDGVPTTRTFDYDWETQTPYVRSVTRTTSGSGKTRVEVNKFAAESYSGMRDANMLTQASGTITYAETAVPGSAVAADATTWSERSGVWRPCSSFAWSVPMNNAGASTVDLGTFNYSARQGTNYQFTGAAERYAVGGGPMETRDAKGILSSIVYRNDIALPIGEVRNGSFAEASVFTGDYKAGLHSSYWDHQSGWMKGNEPDGGQSWVTLNDDSAHTHYGQKSIHVKSHYAAGRRSRVYPGKAYFMSAWVKVVSGAIQMKTDFRYCPMADTVDWPDVSLATASTPGVIAADSITAAQCNGQWKLMTLEIPADSTALLTSGLAWYAQAWVGTDPGKTLEAYVDDVRFYPADALVTSTFYDMKWRKPMLSVDANGNPGHLVEHDGFGRPVGRYKVDKTKSTADVGFKTLVRQEDYHTMGECSTPHYTEDFEDQASDFRENECNGTHEIVNTGYSSDYSLRVTKRTGDCTMGTRLDLTSAGYVSSKIGLVSGYYKAEVPMSIDVWVKDGVEQRNVAHMASGESGIWKPFAVYFDLTDVAMTVTDVQINFSGVTGESDKYLWIDDLQVCTPYD